MSDPDVIDTLAGLSPDSPLAILRDRKPLTRQNAQYSYRALFEPEAQGHVATQERFAIATFVAGLHAQDEVTGFYSASLRRSGPVEGFIEALSDEIARGRTVGPYGAYPKGPLSIEDIPGPAYTVAEDHRALLGARLTAALPHVHLLVFHPRDANAASLQALLDAGWTSTGIVTVSQLVAFLAFQIRAVAGLRTLAAASS